MNVVDIIVPVLARPQNVAPLLDSIDEATQRGTWRVLFVCDRLDEPERQEVQRHCSGGFVSELAVKGSPCYARKINEGYRFLRWGPPELCAPWIFQAADDLRFRKDWLPRAFEWADAHTGVIGTNDLSNGRVMRGVHSTHSLIRRDYIDDFSGCVDEPGVVMHSGYPHEFCDDELVQTAKFRGAYAHAFDSIVAHLHPSKGRAPDDDTYKRGRLASIASRKVYAERRHLWTA